MANSGAEYKCSVGNLSAVTEEDDLKDAFSQFGKILEAKIMKDPDTGMSHGFVTFGSEEALFAAVAAMNGTALDESHIIVDVVQSRPSRGEGATGSRDSPKLG